MNGLQSTSELAQMTKCLFTPSERTSDGKYKWKYNGDTRKGKVYIKNNIVPVGQECHDYRDDDRNQSSVVEYGKI